MDKAKVEVEARELFRKWVVTLSDEDVDRILGVPPKSRRQEKLDDLLNYLKPHITAIRYGKGVDRTDNESLAEAALEWVEKQLTDNPDRLGTTYEGIGYRQAISDVRKNLGLDQ